MTYAHETTFWVQMQIDTRPILAAGLMREERRGRRLVRLLVFGEARVAVDAEHRTAGRLRIGYELRTDFEQPRSKRGDEGEQRVAHVGDVAILVRVEPFLLVIGFQLPQEIEKTRGESKRFGHRGYFFVAAFFFLGSARFPARLGSGHYYLC